MKPYFLLIAKRPFYTIRRFKEELDKRNIKYLYATYKNIKIEVAQNKLHITVKGIPINKFTHIIPRRHSNDVEFNIRYILAKYAITHKINMLNAKVLLNMPHYNKLYQAYLFAENNIPYLSTLYLSSVKYQDSPFGYPVIVKRYVGRIGQGVFLAHNQKELQNILFNKKTKREFFLQEYSPLKEDIRLMIVNQKVVGGWKRKATQNFKTISKGEYTAYDNPPQELKKLGQKVGRLLQIDYGAVDIMYFNNKPYVLEVNLDAGFKAYEQKVHGNVNIPVLVLKNMGM